jgi:hypothetical protein
MPDFSKLYKRPAGIAKRPTALPVSRGLDYPGIIKSFELLEAPTGRSVNYETIIRFHLALTSWPEEGVEEEEKVEEYEEGKKRPIDLAKRPLRRDFYDNRLDLLDDFLRTCGIVPEGRSYEEVLPEAIGQQVLVEVQQYLGRTGEIGNQVNRLVGTNY